MRILMVHDTLAATGGAERYLREVTAALTDRGFQIAFLAGRDQRPAWVQSPVYSLSPSMGLRSGRRSLAELERILSTVTPDLIYVHNLKNLRDRDVRSRLLLPILLGRLVRRAPSVWFVHDIRPVCPNETKIIRATGAQCARPLGVSCVRGGCCRVGDESTAESWAKVGIVHWLLRISRRMTRIIAPSGYIAAELRRNGFDPTRIEILPYFTDRHPAHLTREPAADLLWVGRFSRDRTKWFEAFADMLVHLQDLPWRAAVAGDGELLPEARALVDSQGLAPRITFLGRLSDTELDQWYARSRVVVATSKVAESFCMVGIEAMVHGRPVVAFDVGGIPEWLVDGVIGFAVPFGDSRALAAAARRLLTEPGLADRFGETGRRMVDERFRPAAHVNGLLAAFEAARTQWHEDHRLQALHEYRRTVSPVS